MIDTRTAALALALSSAGLLALPLPARAAPLAGRAVIAQNRAALNRIAGATTR